MTRSERTWNKLVRDRIPEILASQNIETIVRTLDDTEYAAALRSKLLEEAAEARSAAGPDLALELADVLEVVYALADTSGIAREDLETVRRQRLESRGGFSARTFLQQTRETADS